MRYAWRAALLAAVGATAMALAASVPAAAAQPPPTAAPSSVPASEELRRIRDEDQADRKQDFARLGKAELEAITARDRKRLARVRELLMGDLVVTSEDLDHAALVFQHGETPDDTLVAHELALAALLTATKRSASSLPAVSGDRFLVRIGRPQRFGAQALPKPGPDGQLLYGVDEAGELAVTDALRADLFMAPLAVSKREGPMGVMKVVDTLVARLKERHDPAWLASHRDRPAAKRLEQYADRLASGDGDSLGARGEVLKLYRADDLKTPEDYRNAARVLLATAERQPGDARARQLLLAHEMAMVAALRGDAAARTLVASTWDAFLVRVGRPQRYGTISGGPVEATVSPAVRRIFGVPPRPAAAD